VIQQSLDLVEFVLHLEEKLGLEININTLGEKLITETFGELADDLVAIGKGA
jgi:acyl carrier protein